MDPYRPPSEEAQAGPIDAGAARKPIRVWLLQAICVLQLGRTVFELQDEFRVVGTLQAFDPIGLAVTLFWCAVVVPLVFALQRAIPRSDVVAPVLACIWWLNTLNLRVQEWLALPVPRTADAEAAGAIIAELFMLWLAASLIFHRKTRGYLKGVRVD
jgi:hypothetical protein